MKEQEKRNLPDFYVMDITERLYDKVTYTSERFYTDKGDRIDVYSEEDIYPLLGSLQSIIEMCESVIEDLKPKFEEDE